MTTNGRELDNDIEYQILIAFKYLIQFHNSIHTIVC